MEDDADRSSFDQIPPETQEDLFRNFLYRHFLHTFDKLFLFPIATPQDMNMSTQLFGSSNEIRNNVEYYKWTDQIYRDFMMSLLELLEPRQEEAGAILFDELEDLQEIIFHEKGLIDFGYLVDRKARYVLRMSKGTIIGGYHCTESVKTSFRLKCKSRLEGYMIRKEAWMELLEDFDEIAEMMKNNAKKMYYKKIHGPVM